MASAAGTRSTGESAIGAIPANPSARLNHAQAVHEVSDIPMRSTPVERRTQPVVCRRDITRCTTGLYRKCRAVHNSGNKLTALLSWAKVPPMPGHPTDLSTPPTSIPWDAWLRLIRFRNQTGTALLLLPTCWALTLAERGMPSLRLLGIFVAGSFLMRSAGVVLNDLADQSFDRQVARTKIRPLASGDLTRRQAYVLFALLLLPAAGLLWLLNPLTLWLSPIALLLAALYPFSKRVLHIPQAMLGLAFGWGTIMAWAAARGTLESTAWTVFAATIVWAIAYDTIYAIQDLEDDQRIGVKSSALFFGSSIWIAVGLMLGVMLALLIAAGLQAGIGWPYFLMLGAVSVLFAMQTRTLRGGVTPSQAFRMFQAHMWAGLAIFAGMIAGFWA
ncbi:hypothetical protein B566_EDAN000069 [Ephemera danica]|nr:hypothetical protein B566_EDAN000069 [Ephemera danica]